MSVESINETYSPAKFEIKVRYIRHLIYLQKEVEKAIKAINTAKNQEVGDIQSTAYSTLANLAINSGIPEALEILEHLIKNHSNKISILPKSFLIHQRFLAVQALIEKYNSKQIVDLACGLMPHDIITLQKYPSKKYICVDFPEIIAQKSEINLEKFPESPQPNYVSGDLFKKQTWDAIAENLDPPRSVLIFCEGFVMYPSEQEWKQFTQHLKDFMSKFPKAIFVHEDTLKAHLELMENTKFKELYKEISAMSGNKNIQTDGFMSQVQFEQERWAKHGFVVSNRYPQDLPEDVLNVESVFQSKTPKLGFELWEVKPAK
jgi:O-methyltransferase involved in polyketide biosynthesis